jgi:hypothetical protein
LTPLRDIEVIGDVILARLPFGSAIARGALFGVGAHGDPKRKSPEKSSIASISDWSVRQHLYRDDLDGMRNHV